MTEDNIFKIAQEVGLDAVASICSTKTARDILIDFSTALLKKERKECAELANDMTAWEWNGDEIAKAILNRM